MASVRELMFNALTVNTCLGVIMDRFFMAVLIAVFGLSSMSSYARNTPCSGKKGGVSHCTAGGKFMCKNGTVSKSKKVCGG